MFYIAVLKNVTVWKEISEASYFEINFLVTLKRLLVQFHGI